MKKISLLIFVLFPCFAYAQGISLNLGNVSFFLDTKIMEGGTITNVGFGLGYNDTLCGEIKGQTSILSANDELDDPSVADSMIAAKENIIDIFLLPIQYRSKINEKFMWQAGAGLFYEYQKSSQKGYVDMPDLEILGFTRVNSYTSDFSMHIFGPLLDAGLKYGAERFSINFSGGFVPVYFLTAAEKQRMFPLFDTVNHSQKTWGSPYFYFGFDSTLFKYVNLEVKYNYTRLNYEAIALDFSDNENKFLPVFQESTVISHSLMFDISVLIPFGNLNFRIGYGYMLNFYTLDHGNPVSENKQYLILSSNNFRLF